MAIPTSMKAVVADKPVALIKDVPVPAIGKNEILVKVSAVAINPTDWKHLARLSAPGVIMGCDFSGVVVDVGPEPTQNLKKGGRVGGLVHGGKYEDRGAFAEYLKAETDMVWKLPDSLSFEEASTYGIGSLTPVQGFYGRWKEIPLPSSPGKGYILIWSGSTSVGQFAIQIAKAAGLTVVTTASPHNFDLLKQLGAADVFNYNDADVDVKIREKYGDIVHAFDCVTTPESTALCVKSLAPGKPGHVITLGGQPPKATQELRDDVEITPILLYTALGREFEFFPGHVLPAMPEDRKLIGEWLVNTLPGLVESGKLRPNKVKMVGTGLQGAIDGMAELSAGKVSGEKLVVKVS